MGAGNAAARGGCALGRGMGRAMGALGHTWEAPGSQELPLPPSQEQYK